MSEATTRFPEPCDTIGRKVAYLSQTLLPESRFTEYFELMEDILADDVHYIDPVHELRGKQLVLKMLAKYVPRVSNDQFAFRLIMDGPGEVIWRWTISLRIKFARQAFTINGLVHAKVEGGRIVYQREYYDPMESIEGIPLVGKLYKRMLKSA